MGVTTRQAEKFRKDKFNFYILLFTPVEQDEEEAAQCTYLGLVKDTKSMLG